MTDDIRLGFQTMTNEVENLDLDIQGELPHWINGVMFRNGPSVFEVGQTRLLHWFDGYGMIHRYEFADGKGRYSNQLIRSEDFRESFAQKAPLYNEFVTVPERSIGQKLMKLVKPSTLFGDNALINFAPIDSELVAQTEAPGGMLVNPLLASAREKFAYDDRLSGLISTAHQRYDISRKTLFNFLIKLDPWSLGFKYVPYGVRDGSRAREPLEAVKTKRIGYQHALGSSERYVVMMEFPLLADLFSVATMSLASRPYARNFKWDASSPTRILVWDKESRKHLVTLETDPVFAFHHVNGFNDNEGNLTLDIVAYEDPSIIEATYLGALRAPSKNKLPFSWLRRYRIDLNKRRVAFEDIATDHMFEMPRFDMRRLEQPYRYAYGISYPKGSELAFPDRVARIDVESGETLAWHEPHTFPGEPIFIPRPGGGEGDGVVMTTVLDTEKGASRLVVLDAGSLQPIAHADLPHPVPFELHGQWFANDQITFAPPHWTAEVRVSRSLRREVLPNEVPPAPSPTPEEPPVRAETTMGMKRDTE